MPILGKSFVVPVVLPVHHSAPTPDSLLVSARARLHDLLVESGQLIAMIDSGDGRPEILSRNREVQRAVDDLTRHIQQLRRSQRAGRATRSS
jgi:hypothetical protein